MSENTTTSTTLLVDDDIMVNQEDVGGIDTMTSWNPSKIDNVEDRTFGKMLKWFHQMFWKVKNELANMNKKILQYEVIKTYTYTGDGEASQKLSLPKNTLNNNPCAIYIQSPSSGSYYITGYIFPGNIKKYNDSYKQVAFSEDGSTLTVYKNNYSNMNYLDSIFKIMLFYNK